MIAYPAKFIKAAEGGYVVEFIDIPSCVTDEYSRALNHQEKGNLLY